MTTSITRSIVRISFLLLTQIVAGWSLFLRSLVPTLAGSMAVRPKRQARPQECTLLQGSSKRVYPDPSSASVTSPGSVSTGGDRIPLPDPQGLAVDNIVLVDAVVAGVGPAGLLTAIMLAKKYPHRTVQLFDRLSAPPAPDDDAVWSDVAKFYLIGLGGRGQSALREFGVWDAVEQRCVAVRGRKDWPPDSKEGVERIFTSTDKPITTQVLPRDKLVGVLHQHIVENYPDQIQLNYGYEVVPLDFDYDNGRAVLIQVVKCSEAIARLNPSSVKVATGEQEEVLCSVDDSASRLAASFFVAADGTVRTVANAMQRADQKRWDALNPIQRMFAQRPFGVKRYLDDNQRVYKTIPMKFPPEWRPDLNYSARTKEGRVNFDALPANTEREFAGMLLLRKGDPLAQGDTDPVELRRLLDQALPQFSALLDDQVVAEVARKPVSYLPGFRYCGPRLHQGNRCILLGDCAHTVKPYFGLGANSALEDAKVLSDILDRHRDDFPSVVREYSRRQAPQAKALVRISRDLDRPGRLGFVTFILPLILDSVFGGLMPTVFKPNVITMLQREQYTFQQVGRRKRLDRLGQVVLIATGLWAMGLAIRVVVHALARALDQSIVAVRLGLITAAVGLLTLRTLLLRWQAPIRQLVDRVNVVGRFSDRVTAWFKLNKPTGRGTGENATRDARNGESFLTPLGFSNRSRK